MIMVALDSRGRVAGRGITLTEILIAIMILGVGLVSLATLFPIGLLRLRDAARYTRSAYLTESAAADASARGLFTSQSFSYRRSATTTQYNIGLTPVVRRRRIARASLQPADPGHAGLLRRLITSTDHRTNARAPTPGSSGGYGLPFAYDPLWRYQTINPATGHGTQGYYLERSDTFEARFGSGIGFIRQRSVGRRPAQRPRLAADHQFQPAVAIDAGGRSCTSPASSSRPRTWSGRSRPTSNLHDRRDLGRARRPRSRPQPGAARPEPAVVAGRADQRLALFLDVHRPPGQLEPAASTFDGNIVIFENRPFGIDAPCRSAEPARRQLPGLPGRGRDGRRGDLRLQHQRRSRGGRRLRRRRRPHRALALVRQPARPRRQGRRLDRRRDLRAAAARSSTTRFTELPAGS